MQQKFLLPSFYGQILVCTKRVTLRAPRFVQSANLFMSMSTAQKSFAAFFVL